MFNSIFGPINIPGALSQGYGEYDRAGGGLTLFLSNIIKLVTVAAGLFAVINFILAGFGIMTAGGDPEKLGKAQSKIWYSILGLVIIVASFTFASLIGWLIFHDANAILNITIYGP